jgi:hypothetical protein
MSHFSYVSDSTQYCIVVFPVLVTIPVSSIFVMFICLHIQIIYTEQLAVTEVLKNSVLISTLCMEVWPLN